MPTDGLVCKRRRREGFSRPQHDPQPMVALQLRSNDRSQKSVAGIMTGREHFAHVEMLVRQLEDGLTTFTEPERQEVLSLVEAGEYGVAVETAYQIVLEEGKGISRESAALFGELVGTMGIAASIDLNQLESRVQE